MTPQDIDRTVWQAVKRGDRSGTALSPAVVFARTGVWLTLGQVAASVDRLLDRGNLCWRSQRVRRRVVALTPPADVRGETIPAQPAPGLWEVAGHA